jgi:hypothetical protein
MQTFLSVNITCISKSDGQMNESQQPSDSSVHSAIFIVMLKGKLHCIGEGTLG